MGLDKSTTQDYTLYSIKTWSFYLHIKLILMKIKFILSYSLSNWRCRWGLAY